MIRVKDGLRIPYINRLVICSYPIKSEAVMEKYKRSQEDGK
jgi:hypothetical protein